MSLGWIPLLVSLATCIGMIACLELGKRYGRKQASADPNIATSIGVLDTAVLALLGLLIAFTFSSASNRFELRRHLAVQESNDLGTAWLRLDLLPPEARVELQQLFREYVDARIETYNCLPDMEAAARHWGRSSELQARIWSRVNQAIAGQPVNTAGMLLLPALNSMFDTASARRAAVFSHQPALIFIMLIALALCTAALVGHALARDCPGGWLHTWAFALITSLTVYVILDLEYPSIGLIRLDLGDQLLSEVRASMK